ncbi:MAG: hypothetical protein IKG21_01555 [Atopobiaceae bacterium]|nr:hypothetical protein [Atopobiaceae bacterium]
MPNGKSRKALVVATSLALSIAPLGTVLAEESVDQNQPAAEAVAQEQEVTAEPQGTDSVSENAVGEDVASEPSANGGTAGEQADGETDTNDGAVDTASDDSEDGTDEKTDDEKATASAEEKSLAEDDDEAKQSEAATPAATAMSAAATDDDSSGAGLGAQFVEYQDRDGNQIDKDEVSWREIDAKTMEELSKLEYKEEDGIRFYHKPFDYDNDGNAEMVMVRAVRVFEDGSLRVPENMADLGMVTTDHYVIKQWGITGTPTCIVYEYDEVIDVLTEIDQDEGYYYKYSGGDYPRGNYVRVTEKNAKYYGTRNIGKFVYFPPSGVEPGGGLPNASGATDQARTASYAGYESGTTMATPATGGSYVSATASEAVPATSKAITEAVPATSDATSFVGALTAGFGALVAFGSAKVLRRRK